EHKRLSRDGRALAIAAEVLTLRLLRRKARYAQTYPG
ncbi:hypothetical protein AAULR_06554, partial [Lacticaseibacillus rhamnosus MTCC 5462]